MIHIKLTSSFASVLLDKYYRNISQEHFEEQVSQRDLDRVMLQNKRKCVELYGERILLGKKIKLTHGEIWNQNVTTKNKILHNYFVQSATVCLNSAEKAEINLDINGKSC